MVRPSSSWISGACQVHRDRRLKIRFAYGGKSGVVQGRQVLVASKGEDGSEGTADAAKSW